MPYKVLVIPGDGIGPEVVEAALYVINAAAAKYGVDLEVKTAEAGDAALRKYGVAMPPETLKLADASDVIFKGPIGESAYDVTSLIRMRYVLYANIRPVKNLPGVPAVRDIDCVFVRENVEDVYVGAEYKVGDVAIALKVITGVGTRRVARVARRYAEMRKRKVTVVHKANVLRVVDAFFRDVALEELKGLEVDQMYVDAAAMELVRNPLRFDVVLTTNQYGDILTDLAAQVAGGLGLAPSGNLGDGKAMFEPVHGAAFDIAGRGIANPIATILSAAMMFEWLGRSDAAQAIRSAVERSILQGVKTPDIGGNSKTAEVGRYIASIL
ncbi:isocitrate/isopropylmalate dehydrogenase family protein [Pyrobaculum neutrophilum]|uniref:3-isopropylmalate dehydrogenase n=1 Tax=Pyrobaculum neutrophilum (strain DSM 2338 / JCM 9278 / NBRC 100436 / V24Sta) TaxID=444157 RepID=B1YDA7_PYRNV|nr:isocitrate/isopropylmalate dehydrogenase family protein [Pyrobaculum neutrophilum]ACB39770.1 3-isopropylmalate dehydrogenase [Pyrobaculum neutrophilum V24Sta]